MLGYQFIYGKDELFILRFSAVAWQATCGPEFTECNQGAALLLSGIQFRVNLDCSSVLSVADHGLVIEWNQL